MKAEIKIGCYISCEFKIGSFLIIKVSQIFSEDEEVYGCTNDGDFYSVPFSIIDDVFTKETNPEHFL